MRHRLPLGVLFVALFAGLPVAQSSRPSASSGAPQRIVAIGDIHGSAEGLVGILKAAGLVDDRARWIGGTALLVQTGDYLDRGDGVREVMDLLMRLQSDASRAGGRVEVLLGNHEVMNLLHDFRDVSPAALAAFADRRSEDRRKRAYKDYTTVVAHQGGSPIAEAQWMDAHPAGLLEYVEALAPRGRYGRWLRERKVVVRERGTIFMHAGLSPATTGSLDDVNRTAAREVEDWDRTRAAMVETGLIRPFFTLRETVAAAIGELERISLALKERSPPGDHVTREFVQQLQALTAIGQSSLFEPEGPLWFRGLAMWPDEDAPKIAALLARFEAARFVTGHTPMLPGRITPRFDNRVFLIDTGMLASHYKGGRPAALEISGDSVSAIYTTGRDMLVPTSASR